MGSSSWKNNSGRRYPSSRRLSRKKKCSERRKQAASSHDNTFELKNENKKTESDDQVPLEFSMTENETPSAVNNNEEKIPIVHLESDKYSESSYLKEKEYISSALSDHNYSSHVNMSFMRQCLTENENSDLKITTKCIEEDIALNNLDTIKKSIENEKEINEDSEQFCDFVKAEEPPNPPFYDKLNDIIPTDINKSDSVREIVELDYLYSQLLSMFVDHGDVKCKYKLKCVSRTRKGLRTIFRFQCEECKYEQLVHSENPDTSNKMGINKASVLGTINIGIGHTQLLELLASMNINCMTDHTYKKNQEMVLELLDTVAFESMRIAGEEEKRIAINSNHTHNGIPWISVVIDGSWMTRSYGTNYNSLSGVAVIIGSATNKVLFVGIRNKYCFTCAYAERNGIEPRNHTCYKNWDTTASSTSMESDAIVEGFKSSIATHGLIYKVFVSDGDSNVYKALMDNNVYRDENVVPTRIRCYNHLQRNLASKLITVSKSTQPRGTQRIKNFAVLRNKVKDNILTVRKLVEESVDFRKSVNDDWNVRKEELKKDILNISSHIFGEHKACENRAYVCYEKDKKNDERECNLVPFLKRTGMYQKIEEALQYISNFSESLLHKLTNNIAESFNALICVTIGGKRINLGLTSQYNTRVYAAVLRHNTQQVITEVHKSIYDSVPDLIVQVDEKRQLKIARNREGRYLHGRKRRFTCKNESKKYYGINCQEIDMNEEDMEQAKKFHFEKLINNQSNREEIERNTRDQRNSMEWLSLRKQLLTASHFGKVICSQDSTSCAPRVKEILYSSIVITPAMQYGIDHEAEAIHQLQELLCENILPCGLFIDPVHSFLACTPDGIIGEEGIVEVKCPYSAKDMKVEEAMKTVTRIKTMLKENSGKYELNKRHSYYYQVQGQLHITGRSFCIFAVWTTINIIHIRIDKDDQFWKENMEPSLIRFYNECMLPEILDSRYNRNLPIRDPPYIIQAKEEKKRKAEEKKKLTNEDMNKTVKRKGGKAVHNGTKKICLKKDCAYTDSFEMEEGKDCTINEEDVEFVEENRNREWTVDDTIRCMDYLEDRPINLDEVAANVTDIRSLINDDSLDLFIRFITTQTTLQIQSVNYVYSPQMVEPIFTSKGVAIIGGLITNHWRVAYYDGNIIKIYDTLISCTSSTLHERESLYLTLRFPRANSIQFENMAMQQPDGTSCGIYAAAILTDLIFGNEPSTITYSLNTRELRNHFMKILTEKSLTVFPRQ